MAMGSGAYGYKCAFEGCVKLDFMFLVWLTGALLFATRFLLHGVGFYVIAYRAHVHINVLWHCMFRSLLSQPPCKRGTKSVPRRRPVDTPTNTTRGRKGAPPTDKAARDRPHLAQA